MTAPAPRRLARGAGDFTGRTTGPSRVAARALGAPAQDGQVADVGDERVPSRDRLDDLARGCGVELPRTTAQPTLEMRVLGLGQDVEFLASGGGVTVA
ncbi:MAG: hypothetical protein QOF49_1013, partial [Chloroflexota bacterium]|nr:hypothetical protein [Chloroflexota bacterium]